MRARLRRSRLGRPIVIGITTVVIGLVALGLAFVKEDIGTFFRSGDILQADFARDYRLDPNHSEVKMAGVVVGVVTDVQKGPGGDSVVSMKVDEDLKDKLGTAPSAIIRPTTLLGGKYYVELAQGGGTQPYDGGPIPVERTEIPIELDQVLAAIPPPAQTGLQTLTRQLDGTLANGGTGAITDLLRDAPGTLESATPILQAAQGGNPDTDLPDLVSNLDTVAQVMTRHDGQLGDIVNSLQNVTAVLSASRRPLADTVQSLPQTLQSTRDGLDSLQVTLGKLTDTAGKLRPAVQQLGPLLAKSGPVLREARPLVRDLRPLLQRAQPIVQQLVPTAQQATGTLDNLRGPVLNRLNGPVAKTLNSPWTGSGYYAGDGGNGHLLYQEIGYLAAHGADVSLYGDKNGQMVGLALGVGLSTVGGANLTLQNLLESLGALPSGGTQQPAPRQQSPLSPVLPDNSNGTNPAGGLLPPLPLPLGSLDNGSGG